MKTYFFQSVRGGPIKIGKSKNPFVRLRELQTGSPFRLQMVGLIDGDRETELHAKFLAIMVGGEWFNATTELVEFIVANSEACDSKPVVSPVRLPAIVITKSSRYGGSFQINGDPEIILEKIKQKCAESWQKKGKKP